MAEAASSSFRRDFKNLRHLVGAAIHRYSLIEDGDIILAGVSGGKDSLLMLRFLADLKKRAPVSFKLGAVHLGNGAGNLKPWFKTMALDFYEFLPAPYIAELDNYVAGGPSPCFSCSRVRRNALFEMAGKCGATSLALGHHLDDARETFLLNVFFSGNIDGLLPRQDLFEGRLKLIRPLFLVPENLIRKMAEAWQLPVMSSGCPADGHTTRQEMKNLIAALARKNPKVTGNLTAVVEAAALNFKGPFKEPEVRSVHPEERR